MENTKKCKNCDNELPLDQFYKTSRGGFQAECKSCASKKNKLYYEQNRDKLLERVKRYNKSHPDKRNSLNYRIRDLKKKYDITLSDYSELLNAQNNSCAICGKRSDNMRKSLSVDHDHSNNKIRGLLCAKCNLLLGLAMDDVLILNNAIKYLNKYNDNNQ